MTSMVTIKAHGSAVALAMRSVTASGTTFSTETVPDGTSRDFYISDTLSIAAIEELPRVGSVSTPTSGDLTSILRAVFPELDDVYHEQSSKMDRIVTVYKGKKNILSRRGGADTSDIIASVNNSIKSAFGL